MDTVSIVEQNTSFAGIEINVNSVLVNAPSGYNITLSSPSYVNLIVVDNTVGGSSAIVDIDYDEIVETVTGLINDIPGLRGPQGEQGVPGPTGISGGSWWF